MASGGTVIVPVPGMLKAEAWKTGWLPSAIGEASYTQQAGPVTCAITPEAVWAAGAQWRLTSGPDTGWKDSGDTVSGLPLPGNPYTVTFSSRVGWISPADLPVSVTHGGTAAVQGEYTIRTFIVTFQPGARGSLAGGTPTVSVTVSHGDPAPAAPAVTPAAGWAFAGWSPVLPPTIVVDAETTAQHARITYTLTHLAGVNGSIVGPTPQTVNHGEDGAEVTATPATGFVFVQWSDGVLTAARTDTHVLADLTVTALFQAASPAAPNGAFTALVEAAAVVSGRGWWDLTGTYSTTAVGNPLVLTMVHDSGGRITGTAIYTVAPAAVVTMPIKGSVKGSSGGITMAGTLKGADAARTVMVSLTLNLAVDTSNRQLVGRLAGSIRSGGVTVPVGSDVTLPIQAPMDGTWTLRFQLGQEGRSVAGTALLTLSNGVDHAFVVQGRISGATAALSLVGAPADAAAKAIKIRTAITPLEGGWARLESFSGKGYGQTLGW